jgi:hypothetical protein
MRREEGQDGTGSQPIEEFKGTRVGGLREAVLLDDALVVLERRDRVCKSGDGSLISIGRGAALRDRRGLHCAERLLMKPLALRLNDREVSWLASLEHS